MDCDGCEAFLKYQFSADGHRLAHFVGGMHSMTGRIDFRGLSLYEMENDFDWNQKLHILWDTSDSEFSVPNLSKNGKSLLLCNCRKEEQEGSTRARQTEFTKRILVIPNLSPESESNPGFIELPGERASWGLNGEYLLVWDTDDRSPRLSVYETDQIAKVGKDVKPFAQRTLRLGLVAWKAVTLKPQRRHDGLRVLLYEMTELEDRRLRRFLIWDTWDKSVFNEVQMNMYQKMDLEEEHLASTAEHADRLAEFGFPARSYERLYHSLLGDVFPSFCSSDDGNWIGAFSWRRHGGAISCVRTGVTAWKFRLPDDLRFDSRFLPNQAAFDPKQRHFIIFGSSAVLACMPGFLSNCGSAPLDVQSLRQSITPSSDSVESQNADVWNVLPSAAVSLKWKMKLGNGGGTWRGVQQRIKKAGVAGLFMPGQTVAAALSPCRDHDVVDASQTTDGSLVALLLQNREQEPKCSLFIAKKDKQAALEPVEAFHFPTEIEGAEQPFVPSRVIVFENTETATNTIILFSREQFPLTLFYDLEAKKWDVMHLDINKCLDISPTEDRKQIVLLDVWQVCLLNLEERRITTKVKYEVNFEMLLGAVHAEMKWRSVTELGVDGARMERKLSDDGHSVLLAWHIGQERSIVVHPDTKESDCVAQIQEAHGNLSDFCALSASGTSTSFVNIGELERRKITIGIFNEWGKELPLP